MADEVVGVAGLGFLGRGIVACLAAYGLRVVAYGRTAQSRLEAEAYADLAMRELVLYAGFPATLPDEWRSRVEFVDDVRALASTTFVIESVTEDIGVKNDLFDAL